MQQQPHISRTSLETSYLPGSSVGGSQTTDEARPLIQQERFRSIQTQPEQNPNRAELSEPSACYAAFESSGFASPSRQSMGGRMRNFERRSSRLATTVMLHERYRIGDAQLQPSSSYPAQLASTPEETSLRAIVAAAVLYTRHRSMAIAETPFSEIVGSGQRSPTLSSRAADRIRERRMLHGRTSTRTFQPQSRRDDPFPWPLRFPLQRSQHLSPTAGQHSDTLPSSRVLHTADHSSMSTTARTVMYPSPRATAIASPSSRYLPTTGRDRHSNTPVLSLIDTPSRTNSSSESYADRGGDPSTTPAWTVGSPASLHPNFGNKSVFNLECAHCAQTVCRRGMKASLLADTQVELFSTDIIPESRVELVAENYNTHNCNCRIRDFACLGCGNVVGYHITQPCESCMSSCNNGHFWMFHSGAVNPVVRAKPADKKFLVWAELPTPQRDLDPFETLVLR